MTVRNRNRSSDSPSPAPLSGDCRCKKGKRQTKEIPKEDWNGLQTIRA